MGKANPCLKRTFIILTSLIAILSALSLAVVLFTHGYFYEHEEADQLMVGIHTLYVFDTITMILAIIGIYGACKEKKWALIVFTVGMILAALFMFGVSVLSLAFRHMIDDSMTEEYLDFLPLSNANTTLISSLDEIQSGFECCGLKEGYKDWGYNISESCLCGEKSTNPCVAAPKNSSLFEKRKDDQPIMIYAEPCLPFMISRFKSEVNLGIAIYLVLTLFWAVVVALSITILCQLRRKADVPPVVYSAEAKAGNYSALSDAADCT